MTTHLYVVILCAVGVLIGPWLARLHFAKYSEVVIRRAGIVYRLAFAVGLIWYGWTYFAGS